MTKRSRKTRSRFAWPAMDSCATLFCIWSLVTVCFTASARADDESATEVSGYEVTFPALGTLVSIKVFSEDEQLVESAIAEAEQRIKDLESTLTDYDPESETAQLTELAVNKFVPVSPDLWKMLAASELWYKRSGGAFDASLGSLTRLWRGERRLKQAATPDQLQKARDTSGWSHVRLDSKTHSVQLGREGVHFDFGAIGKGFVVDEVFKLLSERGLKSCLVNISGNMRCGDPPPGRDGWRIAVAPLEQHDPPLKNLLLKNTSIATSGDLWQFVVVDGQRRSHIFDPRTGTSVRGPISATILAETATDADACATAVCVLGPTAGALWVSSLPGVEALILEHSDPQQSIRYIATAQFAK